MPSDQEDRVFEQKSVVEIVVVYDHRRAKDDPDGNDCPGREL
jgi:hypothetical protein